MIKRLDGLIHQPWLKWVPQLLTGWVCDLYDHKLGMSWSQIRSNRHHNRALALKASVAPGADIYHTYEQSMALWNSSVANTITLDDMKVTYRRLP